MPCDTALLADATTFDPTDPTSPTAELALAMIEATSISTGSRAPVRSSVAPPPLELTLSSRRRGGDHGFRESRCGEHQRREDS